MTKSMTINDERVKDLLRALAEAIEILVEFEETGGQADGFAEKCKDANILCCDVYKRIIREVSKESITKRRTVDPKEHTTDETIEVQDPNNSSEEWLEQRRSNRKQGKPSETWKKNEK